ncbi:MAG TPA: hypothetical protein VKG44_11390 [Candidatus Baltobacteraceae bacterium]|nr:hypothetical protein [Candidatus Baltobacteraceae bacterium]
MTLHRRATLASALCALALLLGPAGSRADAVDPRQTYRIQGTSAQVAPHMELAGTYMIYLSAHNTPFTSHHDSCLFSATLDGEEHPTPARYVKWGTVVPLMDIPFYKKQIVINFEPGHYQFHIFPLADCSYTILVMPWDVDRTTGPMAFVAAKVFDEGGTQIGDIRWGQKYDAAIYVSGGVKGATGELQVVQDGAVRSKIALQRSVAEDGGVYFHVWIEATNDNTTVHPGPLTLRFNVNKDSERMVRDLTVTLGK